MPARQSPAPALTFAPLTPKAWPALEALFGRRGACGGCWCMTPRLAAAAYERQKGEGNRRALRELVARGTVPGILAYAAGAPIGWCAIEPRERFAQPAAPPVHRAGVQRMWNTLRTVLPRTRSTRRQLLWSFNDTQRRSSVR